MEFPSLATRCALCQEEKTAERKGSLLLKEGKKEEQARFANVFKRQVFDPLTCIDGIYYLIPFSWVKIWKQHVTQADKFESPGRIRTERFLEKYLQNQIRKREAREQAAKESQASETTALHTSPSEIPENTETLSEVEKIKEEERSPGYWDINEDSKLAYDPLGEEKNLFYSVSSKDWRGLVELYTGGPAITMTIISSQNSKNIEFTPPVSIDAIALRVKEENLKLINFEDGWITVERRVAGSTRSSKRLANKHSLKIQTSATTTVAIFKLQIFEKTDLPPLQQRLLFGEIELENDQTLGAYGITLTSTLTLEVSAESEGIGHWDVADVFPNYAVEEGFEGSLLHGGFGVVSESEKDDNQSTNQSPTSSASTSPKKTTSTSSSSSNALSRGWQCLVCESMNEDNDKDICGVCQSARQWKCSICTYHNVIQLTSCEMCGQKK